ncbi:Heme oxygenase [Caulifigura coniformis]|uniref:Heme oxygenase n=2 Tax=Caulifigura coniformis TaxID=2527983 RepID=A0A517SMQ1_9PLAN|nr:Heme oxygenase [Caulifigura coniformis]
MAALRETTAEAHQALERTVDLPRRLESATSYRRFLEAFLGFYEPVEDRLRSIRELEAVGIAPERLQKSKLLKSDLTRLGTSGQSLAQLPRCQDLPSLQGVPAALGTLYVLEGATLGGQLVRREVERRLADFPECGHSFFSSYGPRVGAMWKAFGDCVSAYVANDPGSDGLIVDSAVGTFQSMQRWLEHALKS